MTTQRTTSAPTKDDLAEGEVAVAIEGQPDDLGRVKLTAYWLDDYLPPDGVRGQFFYVNLADFLAREQRHGHTVRGLDEASAAQLDAVRGPVPAGPMVIEVDAIAEVMVAGRRLADYRPMRDHLDHEHPIDAIVGYVVRETVRDKQTLWHGPVDERGRHAHCGYDVAVVDGAHRAMDTWPIRDAYRSLPGGYAVVDNLYRCGCRSY